MPKNVEISDKAWQAIGVEKINRNKKTFSDALDDIISEWQKKK